MVGIYPAGLSSENIRSEQVVREEPYQSRLRSTLRMREDTIQNNLQQTISLQLSTLPRVLCGNSRSLEKTQYGWITANREKANKQPLLATFSSSV